MIRLLTKVFPYQRLKSQKQLLSCSRLIHFGLFLFPLLCGIFLITGYSKKFMTCKDIELCESCSVIQLRHKQNIPSVLHLKVKVIAEPLRWSVSTM